MDGITKVLNAIEHGDPHAAEQLLPLVYDELRKLAAERMAQEKPGQTLQATALVHEAYLRLVGGDQPRDWDGRGHFFAAAAEAMRRILIDNARRKNRLRHGQGLVRVDLDRVDVAMGADDETQDEGPDRNTRPERSSGCRRTRRTWLYSSSCGRAKEGRKGTMDEDPPISTVAVIAGFGL